MLTDTLTAGIIYISALLLGLYLYHSASFLFCVQVNIRFPQRIMLSHFRKNMLLWQVFIISHVLKTTILNCMFVPVVKFNRILLTQYFTNILAFQVHMRHYNIYVSGTREKFANKIGASAENLS
jgi:hypothetical protein